MSNYEYEQPREGLEDLYARHDEREYMEYLRAREERERDFRGPDPRPPKAMKRAYQPKAERAFRDLVVDRDGCVVHDNPKDCEWPPQAHHVLPQQFMRRNGLGALLWDPRLAVGLCAKAHRQHHNGVRRLRLSEIPAEVVRFIHGLGHSPYLERHYLAFDRDRDPGDETVAA